MPLVASWGVKKKCTSSPPGTTITKSSNIFFTGLYLKKYILQEAVLRQICNVKNVAKVFDIHYTKHISCVS